MRRSIGQRLPVHPKAFSRRLRSPEYKHVIMRAPRTCTLIGIETGGMDMGRFGWTVPLLVCSLLVATVAVQAQTTTSSERMVRAFQDYCINTGPKQARAELTARLGRPSSDIASNEVHAAIGDTWTEQPNGDLHSRLFLTILQIDGIPCSCRVTTAWGEKLGIIKTLSEVVELSEATTTADHGSELIRWTTHARDVPVVVELRVPAYVNEPGRSLALYMNAHEMQQTYCTLEGVDRPMHP